MRVKLVTYLRLYHGRTLRAQNARSLEHIYDSLVLHALQDYAERDEDARAAHARAAVHRDWAVLAELLLRLVHLANEIDEALPGLGHALLRPISELELADGARGAVARVCHLELAQDVLRHVVLGDGVHHEALVTDRSVARPVLMTLLL